MIVALLEHAAVALSLMMMMMLVDLSGSVGT